MENSMGFEHVSLITELTQGTELTRQLMKNLHSCSHEKSELVLEKILSTYAKALSMVTCGDEDRYTISSMLTTPCSPTNNVAAEDCSRSVAVKKRKTLSSGKEQVKVCTRTVFEGHDDGYRWRKYGQKEILGAKFRREYYRCTHRKQGCLATKQVQKSDADPTMLEVTYQGSHICNKVANFDVRIPSTAKQGLKQTEKQPQTEKNKKEQDGMSATLSEWFRVETEDLTIKENYEFPSFDFPSPTYEENIFSDTTLGCNFTECLSPMFMSPASSESSGFSLSPFCVGENRIGQILSTSDSDSTEIVSAPNSVYSSPTFHFDFDFSLDKVDFDTSFPFETPEFSL